MRRLFLGATRAVVVGSLLTLSSGTARAADPRDAAAAEALFEEAKTLLEHGDHAAACPKFAESYRLDPATGALFALALCHERAGKLATAWVEFIETAARANADRNTEREEAARQRASALEPRLSFVGIRVDPATLGLAGLTILRDGVPLGPAAYGTSLPVDPGRHVVRAEAPGYAPWEASFEIGDAPQRAALQVPALVALPVAPAIVPPKPPPSKPLPAPSPGTFEMTPLRLGGVALGAAGVASLGFAAAATFRALDKKASSNDTCDAGGCDEGGHDDRVAAQEAAIWATAGAISGAVLLGAGAVLYVLGKPEASRPPTSKSTLLVGRGLASFRYEF